MRKLNQICTQLPITKRESFNANVFEEYSDIAAVNLMASVTKGFEMMNELLEDYKLFAGKDVEIADGNYTHMYYYRLWNDGHDGLGTEIGRRGFHDAPWRLQRIIEEINVIID